MRRASRRWDRFQISVRSSSSRRQVWIHRSMIEFMRGIRTPLSTTSIPASLRILVAVPGIITSAPSSTCSAQSVSAMDSSSGRTTESGVSVPRGEVDRNDFE